MNQFNTRALTVVAALAAMAIAPQLAAQQAEGVRSVAAPATRTVGAGPNGATLRCRDGSYPEANAPESACEAKGGVAVRFPVRRTAPTPSLVQAAPVTPPTIRAANDSVVIPEGFVSYEQRRAARTSPTPPPANATLLCANGTYIVADTVAARCQAYGGLLLRLEATRKP